MKNLTFMHPYHLVDMSPWPITSACGAFLLTSGFTDWFLTGSFFLASLGLSSIILSMVQWWRDVSREATYQGIHTEVVAKGMEWGMILFIVSEVMFFFSFFWAFFHSSLSPCLELGAVWPPEGVFALDPFGVPLLNTVILLGSGVTVTWAHHSFLSQKFKEAKESLFITVMLGVYFTRVQVMEYFDSSFSMSDSAYGSVFFVATGFHGFHVFIGASFLGVILYRLWNSHFSSEHHFGFEAAAWYWHFVDVVWLFLFTFIYWWGGA